MIIETDKPCLANMTKPPQLPTPREELRKAVEAIHSSGKLSLLERKLVNVLLLNAYDSLPHKRIHSIPVSILMPMVGWEDSQNQQALKVALKSVQATQIEFDLFNRSGPSPAWGVMSHLASAVIKDGVCEYEYSSKLAELLANPATYSMINLNVQRMLSSHYALALYENCQRFIGTGSTGIHTIDTWRKVLGADAPLYDTFKRFNERIIKPSVDEINKLTDITLTFVPSKNGRNVVGFSFEVVAKNAQQSALFQQSDYEAELANSELCNRLMALGIAQRLAVQWLGEDYEKARKVVEQVEQKAHLGKIKKNAAGYARRLFEDGVIEDAQIIKEQKQRAAQEVAKEKQQRANQEAQRAKEDAQRAETVQSMKRISPEERRAYAAQFMKTAQGKDARFNETTGKFAGIHAALFTAWLRERVVAGGRAKAA
jgi:plasmid replication initiation protein